MGSEALSSEPSGFLCQDCALQFENLEREGEFFYAPCPQCGSLAPTTNRPQSYFIRFTPYFDGAFGQVVNSPGEKRRLLKKHDLIEVGGEFKKHIQGKTIAPKWRSPVTTAEVAEKLKEVRARGLGREQE